VRSFHIYQKNNNPQLGFTAVEVILVMSIATILLSLITVNLFKFQHKSQLSSTVVSFLADYKEQQIKAMVGDTSGSTAPSAYGVHIETTSYTLFRNSYGTANFTVSLPTGTQFSTTFPSSQVIFATGSGSLTSFTSGQNTITLKDTGDGSQKVITINRYGVVASVN